MAGFQMSTEVSARANPPGIPWTHETFNQRVSKRESQANAVVEAPDLSGLGHNRSWLVAGLHPRCMVLPRDHEDACWFRGGVKSGGELPVRK